jgi:outer membrane receptor protein involved in Fe transport
MAQATTGTIRGTVNDPGGAAVVGATVKAKNQATGVETAPFKTTGEGNYDIPNLQPGKYTLTVESSGFKRTQITDVTVTIGTVTSRDVALVTGGLEETVTVVAGTDEALQTEQAQISATFEARKVEDLPSNAQGFGLDTLALLVPGVAQNSGGGTNTNGTGLSVNGNRGRSNNFQIDGSDNNDLSVGGPNLFVDNQDQVQEYQVITNNFSAQYGRNLGAVVNIVTKGGGNDFHGTAFEYHMDRRNLDTLNNRERLSCVAGQPCEPPRFLSNVFGGTFGGPIKRNRAFFFGSYEGIRQPGTTLAQSGGFGINASDLPRLTAAFPNSPVISAIVALNPTVLPLGTLTARTDLLNCNATTSRLSGAPSSTFSRCNRDFIDIGTTAANTVRVEGFLLERQIPTPYTQDEYSIRGDMKVTNKDNFYVRYLDQKGVNINGLGSTNGFTGDIPFQTRNLGGTYIRQISSRMVNEFRTVRTKLFVSFGGGCDAKTPGCIPDVTDIENAQLEAFTVSAIRGVTLTGNALRAGGTGAGLPQGRTTTLYDFADNLTSTFGRHSMIFGAEAKYTTATVPFLPNFNGAFTFAIDTASGSTAQQRIFNDAPSAFSISLGNPNVAYTEWDQYYFIQDDWKARDNLTLNIGLRYEYTGQPIDDLSDFTRSRESGSAPFFNPALPVEQRIVPRIAPDRNNFAPRLGFAWVPKFGGKEGFMHTLLGDDATVVRGGYAIAYDPAFYNILLNVANSAPFSIALSATSAQLPDVNPLITLTDIFGASARSGVQSSGVLPIGKLDPRFLGQTVVASNFHSPYSQQYSLGIQRQFGKNNVAEIRYVGNHGIGLFQSVLRNPFVGVSGNYVAQPGVPASAVGKPIATTPCTVGGSSTLPNCIGGLYGFTRNIPTTGGVVAVNFPSFLSQVAPSGVAGLSCVDVAGTPDNEGACNGRILPRGAITSRDNTAQSWYNSMQTRYNGRFLKNALSIGATYTFSKTLDTSSEVFAFSQENSILPQDPFDYNVDRGISALHRPHIFSFNGIYDVPYFKEQRGLVGHLLGGWQMNATHVYNTGRRYTPSQSLNAGNLGVGASYLSGGESLRPFSGNPSAPATSVGITQIDAFLFGKLGTVTDLNGLISLNDLNNGVLTPITASNVRFIYNGPGAAKLFGTPYGNTPRYLLEGPAINQLNFGVFKNTKAFETVRVQFRAEFFNVLNHPQPGYGVTGAGQLPTILLDSAGLASGGFADNSQIALARRRIQFGLRINF